ncbi:ABC transporter permease [Nocardioides pantholopis]|uniref:ABC transporter permease n=1 Tax=Nocardioides pantholopis TaxID=2483798 RepID=UPI000F08FAF0|nr:ABC transporter permease [Nocardioides pantholopis]
MSEVVSTAPETRGPGVGGSLTATVARWLIRLVAVTLGILTILFFLLRLSGDPAAVVAGAGATDEQVQQVRVSLGLDQPLLEQYLHFLADTARLDFGSSLMTGEPALRLVLDRMPATLLLTAVTVVVSVLVGVPLGVLAAARHRRPTGRAVSALAGLVQAVPSFLLGILLLLLLSLKLGWLPTYGSGTPAHLVLPVLTLAALTVARLVRLTRSGMLEALGQDYTRAALARGAGQGRVLWQHALRNALVPLAAFLTIEIAHLISGAVIVESLFAYDGIGRQLVDSIFRRDYPVVQATVFAIAVVVILISAAGELLLRRLDPRIRRAA